MNHKQTLKTYNEWRKGADIEQPNPTDIGNAIDGVLSENDELRAKLAEQRNHIEHFIDYADSIENSCSRMNVFEIVFNDMPELELDFEEAIRCFKSTPAQSLAEVKAEAVIDAANAVVRHNECGFCLHCLLIDHANKIKGAE